ncbi:hypothetical protein [Rubrolithibacter danxiaensis]|uniref:hypothetical protein n=1 Tax=Rubrolithibacter danxiaensis TaxID=3390805 RepID=UPI003BF8ED7B
MSHTFHIPVLGLGFSIDTPLKVARYGISSVVSIVDDELVEKMRKLHAEKNGIPYVPINKKENDSRARRITAYLNLLNQLVNNQFEELKGQQFGEGSDINRYFNLLPNTSSLKRQFMEMQCAADPLERKERQEQLRKQLEKGAIDVNIMSKVDKLNYDPAGNALGDIYTDALAALRGFANSNLNSSLILSAGMNPRLYSYLETFDCFLPQPDGAFLKKIILKVSDFRSAFIQAKFLAKKGLWVSEFRIESGLNCGGHAFATEGFLLGPILEEFKQRRNEMTEELAVLYAAALKDKGLPELENKTVKISVQGGIGTAEENEFLLNHYNLDRTGWGSPFLLVPEATNVDSETLHDLSGADTEDFYVSNSSPLGVPFNNFRKSSVEKQRLERIAKGRPGSPCTKKYLVSNTEFTAEPICTASREYQKKKIDQLKAQEISAEEFQLRFDEITEKICLCESLCSSVYIKHNLLKPKENRAVAICPGPNIAYFSGVFSLDDMIKHIYGEVNLLQAKERAHMFINELNLYIEYFEKDIKNSLREYSDKKFKQLKKFGEQLQQGMEYYKQLIPQTGSLLEKYYTDLQQSKIRLEKIAVYFY